MEQSPNKDDQATVVVYDKNDSSNMGQIDVNQRVSNENQPAKAIARALNHPPELVTGFNPTKQSDQLVTIALVQEEPSWKMAETFKLIKLYGVLIINSELANDDFDLWENMSQHFTKFSKEDCKNRWEKIYDQYLKHKELNKEYLYAENIEAVVKPGTDKAKINYKFNNRWSETETEKLIDAYIKYAKSILDGKTKSGTNASMWSKIASEFVHFNSEQCKGRWRTIRDAYKICKERGKHYLFENKLQQVPPEIEDLSRIEQIDREELRWSDEDTHKLIDYYGEMVKAITENRMQKNGLWYTIESKFPHLNVSSEQCRGRWKTILKSYRKSLERPDSKRFKTQYKEKLDELHRLYPDYLAPANRVIPDILKTKTSDCIERPRIIDRPKRKRTKTVRLHDMVIDEDSDSMSNDEVPTKIPKEDADISFSRNIVNYLNELNKKQEERHQEQMRQQERIHREQMELLKDILKNVSKNKTS